MERLKSIAALAFLGLVAVLMFVGAVASAVKVFDPSAFGGVKVDLRPLVVVPAVVLLALPIEAIRGRLKQRFESIVAVFGIGAFIAFSLPGLGVVGWAIHARLPHAPTPPVGVLIVATVGSLLFLLRLKARAVYGATEIVFALVVAWRTFPDTEVSEIDATQLPIFALVSGCVYLVVRGLDNIEQGHKGDFILGEVRKWRAKRKSKAST